MPRRHSLLTTFVKLAGDTGREARRTARQRELEARRLRASTERQARTLARLAREQEREEAQTRAAEEHAENEQLLREIREILLLAPRRTRDRAEHEAGLEERPFPPPERLEADRARLESEVAGRLAALKQPFRPLITLLGVAGLLGMPAGAALWFLQPALGAGVAAAGLVLWGSMRFGLRKERRSFKQQEETCARLEIGDHIAGELERDRAAHQEAEDRRLSRLRALLDGDPAVSAEAFVRAVEAVELPLGASASLDVLGTGLAQLDIDLHREDEIPRQRSTLLKTGRISYRNRSQKEVREDDARALASLALLFAVVAFDELPALETTLVSCHREATDPATGHDRDVCYASFAVDREEIQALNLGRVDPLVTLGYFEGRFSSSAGFQLKPVEPLTPRDLAAALEEASDESPASERPEAARRVAAPTRRVKERSSPGKDDSSLEIARHVLALAMACGRADGSLAAGESRAISDLIAEHYPLSKSAARRLGLERAALAEAAIGIEGPALELKRLLTPRDLQLVLERVVSVAAADGEMSSSEARTIERIGLALDLAPTSILDLLKRWASPGGNAGGDSTGARQSWLAALELPADAKLDRQTVERAGRRLLDVYAEHRFTLMAPELKEMATKRRELAREALDGLLGQIPAPPPAGTEAPAGPVPPDRDAVRRNNPDLDDIFGA